MLHIETGAKSYNELFKRLYYHIYSNSNSSRAERIITDLSKLLLCKLADDRLFNGNLITSYLNDELDMKQSLLYLLEKGFPTLDAHKEGFSLDEKSIKNALSEIIHINLHNAPSQVIGDAFQALIGPNIRGDKGQFFTPRNVVKCMVNIISPGPNDVIIDPACGPGGFLTETYIYLKNRYDEESIKGRLIGIDKDSDLAYLATALLEITTKGKASIINANSFEYLIKSMSQGNITEIADIILTNPPFGSKIGIKDKEILKHFSFGYNWTYSNSDKKWYKLNSIAKSQDPQILFTELCIKMLKPGGRMGIVLPEGVFGNKNLGFVWDYLKQYGEITAMIDCPRTTFQPSTDTKTNILFFRKYEKGQEVTNKPVLVSVALNCGHDKRGRMFKSNGEPFPDDFEAIAKDYWNTNPSKWVSCNLKEYYFVPRYYYNFVQQKQSKENTISFKELIDSGYISIRKGHEVGSDAYGTGDIPFVRTSDINNLEISIDPTNSVSEEIYNQYAPLQNLKEGDILFVFDGRYRIGNTAILTKYNQKCIVQSHILIISLSENAPFDPYEFLYLLNLPEVKHQVRSLIFIQSTLGTLGKRIEEIRVPLVNRTPEWIEKIKDFRETIETRAYLLKKLSNFEYKFEL